MKKLLTLLLAFVMVFSLTACKNGGDSDGDSTEQNHILTQVPEPQPFLALYSAVRNTLVNFNTLGCGDTSLRLQVDEDMLDLFAQITNMPAQLDISFLEDVRINCSLNYSDGNVSLSAVPVIGGKDVLTLEVLASIVQGSMWMRIPQLSSKYVEQTDVFDGGSYYSEFVSSAESLLTLANCLPETQVVQRLINKYSALALEAMDAQKKTETVTVEGVSQELTVYEKDITEADAANMVIAVLEAVAEDKDIEKICGDLSDWSEEYSGEATDLHELLLDAIPYLTGRMEYAAENADSDYTVHVAVYTRGGSFAGICIEPEDDGALELYTVQNGDSFAVSLILPNDVGSITGKGTEKAGIVSGSFQLEVEGQEIATVKLQELDTVNLSKGTLVITPNKALFPAAVSTFLKEPSLEVSFTAKDTVSLSLALLLESSDALRLTLEHTPKAPAKVTLPSNGISMDQWLQEVDPAEVFERLKDAGVPIDALVYGTVQKQEAVTIR